MPRRLAVLSCCTLALVAPLGAVGSGDSPRQHTLALERQATALRHQLRVERLRAQQTIQKLRRALREARTSPVFYRSPRLSEWLCIHSHEGAWNADTGNGYHGGLQMDMSFQRAYGPEFLRRWGTADRWPPGAQMLAADRAWRVRGFAPWPATARACGLV